MRLTLVAPVIVAACVAMSWSATTGRAVEECLSTPKGAAPEGRHWYYRADKSTGRRCWYLADKGKKVAAQASSPPLPSLRPDAEPAETPAIVASAETPPASAGTPPVAAPNDVVTQFSRQWPHFTRPTGTVGRAPASNSDAEETQPGNAEEGDMPLVWPVLAAEAAAAANAPSIPALKTEQMLTLLIGSLCLAGVIMGLICAVSSIRLRRRVARTWEPRPAPWHASSGTGYRLADDAVDAPAAGRPAADIPPMEELESSLQDLLDGWRRRAA